MEYWLECVSEACEVAGIEANEAQLKELADWVKGAHENYSMATGEHVASRNLECSKRDRIKELEEKLRKEESKRGCPDCKGYGYTISYYGTRSSPDTCWSCQGTGKI